MLRLAESGRRCTYSQNPFITRKENSRAKANAYVAGGAVGQVKLLFDVGMDAFDKGMCLSSVNKITIEKQNIIVEVVRRCFDERRMDKFERKDDKRVISCAS